MSNDDDDYVEDLPPEALSGSASGSGDTILADLLLGLISSAAQLNVLLSEASRAELKAVQPRLATLRTMMKALPQIKVAPQTIGFVKRKR